MNKLLVFPGIALIVLMLGLLPSTVRAQEGEADDLGWSDTADFSFVLTAGNSDSTTLGFNNTLRRRWERSLFELKLGALRAENTSNLGVAIGTPTVFTIPEVTATTAENYYLAGSYDRKITERLFWYAGAGWLRNEFAGIKDRYTVSAGVGNIWYDRERLKFKTNYGVSYTDQTDVVEVPGADTSFAGVLVGWNFLKKFGQNASYGNDFIFNYNVEESSDWRWTMDQWITTSLTDTLALKVSLLWLYNNEPAFGQFTLLEDDDLDPNTPPVDLGNTVIVQLDELDTIFSISLVVDF